MNVNPITRKAASWRSLNRYKVDDDVAGCTVRGHGYRDGYKRAVRHTRRTAKMALAAAVANLAA